MVTVHSRSFSFQSSKFQIFFFLVGQLVLQGLSPRFTRGGGGSEGSEVPSLDRLREEEEREEVRVERSREGKRRKRVEQVKGVKDDRVMGNDSIMQKTMVPVLFLFLVQSRPAPAYRWLQSYWSQSTWGR